MNLLDFLLPVTIFSNLKGSYGSEFWRMFESMTPPHPATPLASISFWSGKKFTSENYFLYFNERYLDKLILISIFKKIYSNINKSNIWKIYIYIFYIQTFRLTGLVGRVLNNGPGDLDSVPGRFIPKTSKMILDASCLDTQQYEARIKSKVEQSWERSRAIPYTSL